MDPSYVESGNYVYINRYPACRFFSHIRTAFGIFTVFILWCAAFDSVIGITSVPIGIYLAVISCPVFLLECGKVIRICCGTDGALCSVFSLVLGFDRWKRGIFYCVMAVPCFFQSIATWFSEFAGLMLFICGCLYVAKVFQKKKVPTFVPDPASATGTRQ
ncbi:unnamed protein product [Bursaphelenchus xylophilus]|uniref:(pine wood nematode) hypothetical protein n=1 Tax=Bursaphelenchus xylophilus TaxID=6326 RepID=A0A1I7S6L6_BURXY|nr:unnamed protein product [Bursaphelenchus xylophilus]CAG9120544.1 unnamed protein product [Bursaphelenchus xylophilus]